MTNKLRLNQNLDENLRICTRIIADVSKETPICHLYVQIATPNTFSFTQHIVEVCFQCLPYIWR